MIESNETSMKKRTMTMMGNHPLKRKNDGVNLALQNLLRDNSESKTIFKSMTHQQSKLGQ